MRTKVGSLVGRITYMTNRLPERYILYFNNHFLLEDVTLAEAGVENGSMLTTRPVIPTRIGQDGSSSDNEISGLAPC
jgi:hypothetical protein